MIRCATCNQSKPASEFRSKETGPRAGYVFPNCKQCERDQHLENIAAELRVAGYVVTKGVL